MRASIDAVDFFAGAGGTSTGLVLATREAGMGINLTAVNHNAKALAAHEANFQWAKHLLTGVQNVSPDEIAPEGRLDIMVASPECIYFSRARGGKPVNDQERVAAWYLEKFVRQLEIRSIFVENVPEFVKWGPLINGYPDRERYGQIFRKWLKMFRRYGYNVDYKIINAADYGDATTRKRFFMLARLGNEPVTWPIPTHSKFPQGNLKKWVAAKTIIDWDNPGKSIFSRERPLSPNTIARIIAGLKKYSPKEFSPFIVLLEHSNLAPGSRIKSIEDPLVTITGAKGGGIALGRPFLLPVEGIHRGNTAKDLDDPVGTLTQRGYGHLITPFLMTIDRPKTNRSRFRSPDEPIPTVIAGNSRIALIDSFFLSSYHGGNPERNYSVEDPTPSLDTSNRFALIEQFIVSYYGHGSETSVNEPLGTATGKDRFGLVQPSIEIDGTAYKLEVLYRMLTPEELAAAMGFPAGYKFMGNRNDKVKQIGNAVAVNTAKALISSLLARGNEQPNLMEVAS